MILSDSARHHFKTLHAEVEQGMAARQAVSPYWLDHVVVRHYECLRQVWIKRVPIKTACAEFKLSRPTYYHIEQRFVNHGALGLFPRINGAAQCPRVEAIALMAKEARPSLSNQMLLRLCEAVPGTRQSLSPELISQVLASHGLAVSCQASERRFFADLQRRLAELQRLLAREAPQRDTHQRRQSFLLAERDPLQHALELLRELFYNPSAKVRTVLARYGMARSTFHRLLASYRELGPYGLIPARSPGKDSTGSETQLQVMLCKLRYPNLSAAEVAARLKLRCSRFVVNRVFHQFDLTDKTRLPAALDEFVIEGRVDADGGQQDRRSAYLQLPGEMLLQRYRLNPHFQLLLGKMSHRSYRVCDPGPFILAPFVSELGIVQAFECYGPARQRGKDLSRLALTNVLRILAGYRRIKHLSDNRDRSVALASGVGLFGSVSRFYEDTVAFNFEQLHALRLDLVRRAMELGLIEGVALGFDFHFQTFFGHHAAAKLIGKGPSKSGEMKPGFRPHVAWDLASNVIVNIAYFQGSKRAPQVLREFCESDVFAVLDRLAVEEIYIDSEYTKEADLAWLKQQTCPQADIFICLKQNPQIKKLIAPALAEEAGWEKHDAEDEHKVLDVSLPRSSLSMRLVLLRNVRTRKHVRCFGSTSAAYSGVELLDKYRYRWLIENGLKDLVHSYFLDESLGYDPAKVEFELYCVMVARLAYEYFVRELGGAYYMRSNGDKTTLGTMRQLLFEKQNCEIHQAGDGELVLTLLDAGNTELIGETSAMLTRMSEDGRNKVLWWRNRGLQLRHASQFSSP